MEFLSWFTFGLVLGCGVIDVRAVTTDYPPELAGDASNNDHIEAALDVPKLQMNAYCMYYEDPAAYFLHFVVYQSDLNLKYTDVGPDDGKYVEHELCYYILVTSFLTTGALTEATECPRFNHDGPTDTGDLPNTRTHSGTVQLDTSGTNTSCGAKYETNGGVLEVIYGVYCMRKALYIKQFDYVFLVHTRVNGGECVSSDVQTYTFDVGMFRHTNITRRYGTSFEVYSTADSSIVPDGPQSPDDDNPSTLVTAELPLATEIYLEACLTIPDPFGGGAEHDHHYFHNKHAAIGISIQECWAYGGTNPSMNFDDAIKFLKNRCSRGENIVGWKTDVNIVSYVEDTEESIEQYERSPNCFRTIPFELATFKRQDKNAPSEVIFECYVEYCFDKTDDDCFSDAVCPYVAPDRKRRESGNTTESVGSSEYPSILRTSVFIAPEKQKVKAEEATCSETFELITITSVISTILVLVIVATSFMMYHIQSLGSNTVIELDHYGRVVGHKNMGYQ